MQIIEFLGIPRSGKTTVAQSLKEKFSNVVYYPERHDLVPKEIFGDNFKHNLWYAKYCVENIKSIPNDDKIHIFERGVVDRLTIGRVYFKMDWFSSEQLEEYEKNLISCIKKVDKVLVFLISVDESVKRANDAGKDLSKAAEYMTNLYSEYKRLDSWLDNCVYLPENLSLDDLESFVAQEIGLINK